jgi:hypothetical protein
MKFKDLREKFEANKPVQKGKLTWDNGLDIE